jgi:hypothetical protein
MRKLIWLVVWMVLYLRDPGLQELIPLRRG